MSPQKRKIQDRNPFSASSDSEGELQGVHLPKAKTKPLMESSDRPRSRGSNREEADMAISDVEQVSTIENPLFSLIYRLVQSSIETVNSLTVNFCQMLAYSSG